MSVHAKKRKIAYGEFEHNMRRFCKQFLKDLLVLIREMAKKLGLVLNEKKTG